MSTRFKYYLRRYALAEISGTLSAIIAAALVFYFSGNNLLAALAGTWGDNLGFYGAILLRDIGHARKHNPRKSFGGHFHNIFLEFGPSEVADSFLIRPASMYLFSLAITSIPLATFFGKITADLIFYAIAIFSREYRAAKKTEK